MLKPSANHRPLSSIKYAFRKAAEKDRKMDRRIRQALEEGDHARADALTLTRLKSFPLKLVAAKEMNEGLKPWWRLPIDQLFDAACSVSAFRVSGEPMRTTVKVKKSGKQRVTHDFGNLDRIGQTMVRISLLPYAERWVQVFQFAALAGDRRGPAAAIEAVFELIEGGFVWMSEIDIQDCYGSFNPYRLVEGLPLPRRVSEAHVVPGLVQDTGNPVVDFSPTHRGGERSRRRSLLPQGGLSSAMVAAMFLGRILGRLTFSLEDVRILVWSDNILVAAKTPSSADAACRALRIGLAQELTGPFTTTATDVRHVADGVDWIGRRFRLRHDGRQLAVPTPVELRQFSNKVLHGLDEVYAYTKARELFRSWVAGWRGSYRVGWPNCEAWVRRVIEAAAARHGYGVVWNRRGGFVRFLTNRGVASPFPEDRQTDDDLSHWKEKVYYWYDIAGWEHNLPESRPSIATIIRRELEASRR